MVGGVCEKAPLAMTRSGWITLCVLLAVAGGRSEAQTVVAPGGVTFPDGSTQEAAAVDPANVLVVAQSGAPFVSIQAALDSITDAGPDNPYLIRVAPGVYVERVQMKQHVDIEGAGPGRTVITSPGAGTGEPTLWTAADAELRELTVRSTDQPGLDSVPVRCSSRGRLRDVMVEAKKIATGLASARGIYAWLCEELVLWRVEVESSGSTGLNSALFINDVSVAGPTLRVYDSAFSAFGPDGNDASAIGAQGTVLVRNSSLSATGAANVNSGFSLGQQHDSQVQLEGVTITVGPASIGSGFGIRVQPTSKTTTIKIDRSSISSPDVSIETRTNVSVLVGASRLEGGLDTASGGSLTCVASYDGSYQALDETCMPPAP